MKSLLLLALAGGSLSAQSVSIGAKVGVPFTDAFEAAPLSIFVSPFGYLPNNRPALVGGTIQLNFLPRFSFEADGLYRRLSILREQPAGFGLTSTNIPANSWEFPLLVKYALLPGPIVRPFVDGGPEFRRITGAQQAPELNKNFSAGFTFGGGVEIKLGRLRFSPEFRYTHWGSESFRDRVNSQLHTNLNQGDFIMGFTF